jgi:IS5 family transposase
LDDPRFFAPFVPFFDPRVGRPSTPMETYLRLMLFKVPVPVGVRVVVPGGVGLDHRRQFCRIALDQPVPHPTNLMKLTSRWGSA